MQNPDILSSSAVIIFKWNFEDQKYYSFARCQLLPDFCCPLREMPVAASAAAHPSFPEDEERANGLTEFNDMLEKSGQFPCTSFVFLNGNLENPQAQRFFTVHGPHIRSLELVEIHEEDLLFSCSSTPKRILLDILTQKTPHLEHLAIGGFSYYPLNNNNNNDWELVLDDPDDLQLIPGSLPSTLKSFSWHADLNYYDDELHHGHHHRRPFDNSQLALEILTTAGPTLTMIKDFNFNTDFEILQQLPAKISPNCLIEHLCLDDTTDPAHLLTFLTIVKPKIYSLQLVHEERRRTGGGQGSDKQRRLFSAFAQLFQSVSGSLKTLDLSHFSCCADIQIPTLSQVTKLIIGSVDAHSYSVRRCFPANNANNNNGGNHGGNGNGNRGMQLAQIFPNLQTLDGRRLQCEDNFYWSIYYPRVEPGGAGKLVHVTTIIIADTCAVQWMESLREICPHFSRAIVHCRLDKGHGHHDDDIPNIVAIMPKIYRYWPHLESLEIRIEDLASNRETKFWDIKFSLDSLLTGMTEEACQKWRGVIRDNGHACDDDDDDDDDGEKFVGEDEKLFRIQSGSKNGGFGVSSLKKLKDLKIIFDHPCLGKLACMDDRETASIMSNVSVVHTFCHLPGLKVTILYDQTCQWAKEFSKRFQSLKPYISFKHWQDEHEN